MNTNLLLETEDTFLRLLDSNFDQAALQELCESASDYFILIQNSPAGPEAAKETFTMLPPHKNLADKYVLGIYSRATKALIGMIDLVQNYPTPGEWIIGLMMFDPAYRGLGLGKQVYYALSSFCRIQGADFMRIGVLDSNLKALRFWQSVGFQEIGRQPHEHKGKSHIMIAMKHQLA